MYFTVVNNGNWIFVADVVYGAGTIVKTAVTEVEYLGKLTVKLFVNETPAGTVGTNPGMLGSTPVAAEAIKFSFKVTGPGISAAGETFKLAPGQEQ